MRQAGAANVCTGLGIVVDMDRLFFLLRLLIILLILVAAPGCTGSVGSIQRGSVSVAEPVAPVPPAVVLEELFNYERVRLGTVVQLRIHAGSRARAEQAAMAAFERIGELESVLSDYRKDSELNRLAGTSAGNVVQVSGDLMAAMARARVLSKRTGGAFDVTSGPLSRLWRTSFRHGRIPSDEAVEDAAARVGWSFMHLDEDRGTVFFDLEGMRLDMGAFGKGWIADAALAVLVEHGCPASLVEIGGDLAVGEAPPGRPGWSVGVALDEFGPSTTVLLSNCGVATSGDAEQFLDVDGVRYSHLFDPRTGWALTVPRAATVVAADAATADALASAVCVLGPVAGRALLSDWSDARLVAADME